MAGRKAGPPLRQIFGRPAATDAQFTYSDALRNAHLVWDETTLDRWLTDPEAVAADNDMAFRVSKAEERAAIIAYLRRLATGQRQTQ